MPSPLYLCLHLRDFATQAVTVANAELFPAHAGFDLECHPGRSEGPQRCSNIQQQPKVTYQQSSPNGYQPSLGRSGIATAPDPAPLAILSGEPPLERVFALNDPARQLGLQLGMSRVQAESFPTTVLRRDREQEDRAFATLITCAQQLSPRVEIIAAPAAETCGATLILDVSGSERLLGSPRQIATTLQSTIAAAGFTSSVAAGHNAHATLLAARGRDGVTVLPTHREAEALAPLPLSVLELSNDHAETLATWGIETLGQLASLPTKSLAARLGQSGLRLQSQARAEYSHLLVPASDPADAPLSEHMELDHPVELLEPLLFLLGHMLEQITTRAAERSLAIASVETTLVLESSNPDLAFDSHPEHRRTIRPALPERNHLTLLKLIQLDLELHPPEAPITALHIEAHPARPQIAQQGLFAAQAPEAGRLEILLARLRKLVGEDHVGAPELLDTHAPEAFRLTDFDITDTAAQPSAPPPATSPTSALRMVRPPREVAVELRQSMPMAVVYEGQRLLIHTAAGPWRSNGAWWTNPSWCREEWDVVLHAEPQRCLRLAHDPSASCWYVIGIYD